MNRVNFQELAEIRIAEAETLLNQGKYDGAYFYCNRFNISITV